MVRLLNSTTGRASMRDLARDPSFASLVSPLAEKGWRHYESLDEPERLRLVDEGRRRLDDDRR